MTPIMREAIQKASTVEVNDKVYHVVISNGSAWIRREVLSWAVHPRTKSTLFRHGLCDENGVLTDKGESFRG